MRCWPSTQGSSAQGLWAASTAEAARPVQSGAGLGSHAGHQLGCLLAWSPPPACGACNGGRRGILGSGPWAAVGAAFRQAQFESRAALWGLGGLGGRPRSAPRAGGHPGSDAQGKVSWPEAQQRGTLPLTRASRAVVLHWESRPLLLIRGLQAGRGPTLRSCTYSLGAGQGAGAGRGLRGGPEHESAHALPSGRLRPTRDGAASGPASQAWSPADRRPWLRLQQACGGSQTLAGGGGSVAVSAGPQERGQTARPALPPIPPQTPAAPAVLGSERLGQLWGARPGSQLAPCPLAWALQRCLPTHPAVREEASLFPAGPALDQHDALPLPFTEPSAARSSPPRCFWKWPGLWGAGSGGGGSRGQRRAISAAMRGHGSQEGLS